MDLDPEINDTMGQGFQDAGSVSVILIEGFY